MQEPPSYQEAIMSKLDQHFQSSLEEPTEKKQTIAKRKPGKKPKVPDSNLSLGELKVRQARRERNKIAASKARKSKESMDKQLTLDKKLLETELENLNTSITKKQMKLQELRKVDEKLKQKSPCSIFIYPEVDAKCEAFPVEMECDLFETEEITDLLVPVEQSETEKQKMKFDEILAMGFSSFDAHPNFVNSEPVITKQVMQEKKHFFNEDLDMHEINSILEGNFIY